MQDIDIKKLLQQDLENLPPDTRKKYKRYLVQLDRKQKHKKITEDAQKTLSIKESIKNKKSFGGTSPQRVKQSIKYAIKKYL